jgi:hypothetical protein
VDGGASGLSDDITIIGVHEFGETRIDVFPDDNRLDGSYRTALQRPGLDHAHGRRGRA